MSRLGATVYRVDERRPGVDLPLLSVSQTKGVIRRSELTDRPARAESLDVYKVCRKGDIVFNKMSIRSGAMGVAQEDGLVTYHYEVMRVRPGFDPRYLVYLMKSDYFTSEMIKRERGIGAGDQVGVRTTEVPFRILRTIECSLPDSKGQVAIADFLDRETAKIDALIDKQRALTVGLRERWQTSIDDALSATNAAVVPVRRAWEVIDCKHSTAEFLVDGEYPLASIGEVQGRTVDLREAKRTSREWYATLTADGRLPELGDLVMSRNATVGACARVTEATPAFALGQDVVLLKPRASIAEYMWYVTRSRDFGANVEVASIGSTFKRINVSQIKRLPMPLPSIASQESVAVQLDRVTAEIEILIAKAERFIDLARERRSALITAAVTGQLDISGEAA